MIVTVMRNATDKWLELFGIGAVCWALGFVYHWLRFSLWILDLVLIPVMGVLYLGGFAAMVLAVLMRRDGAAWIVVIGVLGVVTMLVNPGYRVMPATYFAVHRPLFAAALHTDPGSEYYGNPLPLPLRFLTANGNVSRAGLGEGPRPSGPDVRFFPQWIGIPDDAGGYLYSPERSPAGADLYGSPCADPVDLGDGWWMCNL